MCCSTSYITSCFEMAAWGFYGALALAVVRAGVACVWLWPCKCTAAFSHSDRVHVSCHSGGLCLSENIPGESLSLAQLF